MPPFRSVAAEVRYVLTPKGEGAIDTYERCVCDVKLIGILFACLECGTVMGSMRDAKKPRAQAWTYRKRA